MSQGKPQTTKWQRLRRNEPWLIMAIGAAWCIAAVVSHL